MTRYGYFLCCEERSPAELVRQARLAEDAGFDALWISDHFHPWPDEQGQSTNVWPVIGAISRLGSPMATCASSPMRTSSGCTGNLVAAIGRCKAG